MRGRGHGIRKVTPKFLPRATQDVKFLPPGGSGLRGGGEKAMAEERSGSRASILELVCSFIQNVSRADNHGQYLTRDPMRSPGEQKALKLTSLVKY